MTTTELLLIYFITIQITWALTFILWEIRPLRAVRETFFYISFFLTTPPVVIIGFIGLIIDKLVQDHRNKKQKPVPDTHEVRQDDETGLTLYSVNEYSVGALVQVHHEQYFILDILPPENGVRGYRVKLAEETNEKTK